MRDTVSGVGLISQSVLPILQKMKKKNRKKEKKEGKNIELSPMSISLSSVSLAISNSNSNYTKPCQHTTTSPSTTTTTAVLYPRARCHRSLCPTPSASSFCFARPNQGGYRMPLSEKLNGLDLHNYKNAVSLSLSLSFRGDDSDMPGL